MPSADSCSITGGVAHTSAVPDLGFLHRVGLTWFARRAAEAGSTWRLDLVSRLPAGFLPDEGASLPDRPVEQVSPDKDVDLRCTTAPFTLPLGPSGFVMHG